MYLALGLISVTLSGVGIYMCVQNKNVTREDIEKCFKKVDEQVDNFGNKMFEIFQTAELKINDFVKKLEEQDKKEEYSLSPESERSVELGENVVNLMAGGEKSPESTSDESGEKTLEEFILLSEGEGEGEKEMLLTPA